jgi:hypothetical protein
MNKKTLHHIWTRLRPIKPWYFFALAIISGLICIFALRANNEHMITLRNAVYTADQNNSNVEQALQNLRRFVYSHMNTDLAAGPNAVHPPVQLKYTYDRLVQAESQRVEATNATLYTSAQAYCQATIPNGFSGRYREACINQYVTTHGASAQPIPKNIYEFDFVSPKWSPDLAGWSLIVTILLALAGLVFWAFEDYIRKLLKRHA